MSARQKSFASRLAPPISETRRQAYALRPAALVSHVRQVDILLTATEKEALLLESGLIKKHRPRYNIVLKDDKQYVLFRLDRTVGVPAAVHDPQDRAGRVRLFRAVHLGRLPPGPSGNCWARSFHCASARTPPFAIRMRPCLYHDIGINAGRRASRKWIGKAYAEMVHRVEMLLVRQEPGAGGYGLTRQHEGGVQEIWIIEQAAVYRDQIQGGEERPWKGRRRSFMTTATGTCSVWPRARQGLGLGLLFVRQGRLLDQKQFFWPGLTLDEGPEVVESFIGQFYGPGRFIPPLIVVPMDLGDSPSARGACRAWRHRASVSLHRPRPLRKNNWWALPGTSPCPGHGSSGTPLRLAFAKSAEALAEEPVRIECVDASHLGRHAICGWGRWSFEDRAAHSGGIPALCLPRTGRARRTIMRPWLAGPDGSMESGPPWPDLVLLDGGRGQLSAVEKGLWPNASRIAAGNWRPLPRGSRGVRANWVIVIFRPGRKEFPCRSNRAAPELLFLQKIRDAAHRFRVGQTTPSARKKSVLNSELTSLPGIGPKNRTDSVGWHSESSGGHAGGGRRGDRRAARHRPQAGRKDIRSPPGVARGPLIPAAGAAGRKSGDFRFRAVRRRHGRDFRAGETGRPPQGTGPGGGRGVLGAPRA